MRQREDRHYLKARFGPSSWWRRLRTRPTHHLWVCDDSCVDEPGEWDYLSACGMLVKQKRIAPPYDVIVREQIRCHKCLRAMRDRYHWIH